MRDVQPGERAIDWTGSVYTSIDMTFDGASSDNKYWLARAGTSFDVTNPFGQGGAVHTDLEVDHRSASGALDDNATDFRVNRLSYEWGGTRDQANHWELGRFLQREFPELGVLDGAEWIHRTDGGNRFGLAAGFLPEPTPEMRTGKDLALALFYRWVAGTQEEFSLGTALQKTWHEGKADRDLAVVDMKWRPTKNWTTWTSASVDFYGANDTLKSGAELTEAHANASYRFEDAKAGVGAYVTHFRFPELLRNEFGALTAAQIDHLQITRAGLNAWKDLTRDVRLSARFDHWQDQDDSGLGGEVSASWRNLFVTNGRLELALFDDQGKFSSVRGARATHAQVFGAGSWSLTYELSQHEYDGFLGSGGSSTSSSVRASYDRSLGRNWDLSLFADDRFGGDQDSVAVGFWLTRRF
jgi:hypothetical protein